jgi:hypothetical protein
VAAGDGEAPLEHFWLDDDGTLKILNRLSVHSRIRRMMNAW